MGIIRLLDMEIEMALEVCNRYSRESASDEEKKSYIAQRIHNRLWDYLRRAGIMPAHLHQTHSDIYDLYMNRQLPEPEPIPCECALSLLMKKGCQCGGI